MTHMMAVKVEPAHTAASDKLRGESIRLLADDDDAAAAAELGMSKEPGNLTGCAPAAPGAERV